MDCHSSHDLLNFADFENPSLEPLWSECLKCRKKNLSAYGDKIGVLAQVAASERPIFSSKLLADPSTLYYLDMSADNRTLNISTTNQMSAQVERLDESQVFDICLYTSCAPNHIAWYNNKHAKFRIEFGLVEAQASLGVSRSTLVAQKDHSWTSAFQLLEDKAFL